MDSHTAPSTHGGQFETHASNSIDAMPSSPSGAPHSTLGIETALHRQTDAFFEERQAGGNEEEDPLIIAQREQEEKERALAEAADIRPDDDPALKVQQCNYAYLSFLFQFYVFAS